MNIPEPRIVELPSQSLWGISLEMSMQENRTHELWKQFMTDYQPNPSRFVGDFYSMEEYPSLDYFHAFNPSRKFKKIAAVELKNGETAPSEWQEILLEGGLYAVFRYVGKPSDSAEFYRSIYSEWLPVSSYELENRKHFSQMGEKYLGEQPESEEDFFIPIARK